MWICSVYMPSQCRQAQRTCISLGNCARSMHHPKGLLKMLPAPGAMHLMTLTMIQSMGRLTTNRKQDLWLVSKASAREVLQQTQAEQVASSHRARRRLYLGAAYSEHPPLFHSCSNNGRNRWKVSTCFQTWELVLLLSVCVTFVVLLARELVGVSLLQGAHKQTGFCPDSDA